MTFRSLAFLFLLSIFSSFCAAASQDDGPVLLAVASTNLRGDSVIEGDSILVTVTLYSNFNFLSAKAKKDHTPTLKNALTHRYRPGRRLSQSIATYNGRRYYAVDVEQFFVTPSKLGTISFPSLDYQVELTQRRSSSFFDPFDPFFSYQRRQQRPIKQECKSDPLKIRVVKRPPKTIEDLRRSGEHVL